MKNLMAIFLLLVLIPAWGQEDPIVPRQTIIIQDQVEQELQRPNNSLVQQVELGTPQDGVRVQQVVSAQTPTNNNQMMEELVISLTRRKDGVAPDRLNVLHPDNPTPAQNKALQDLRAALRRHGIRTPLHVVTVPIKAIRDQAFGTGRAVRRYIQQHYIPPNRESIRGGRIYGFINGAAATAAWATTLSDQPLHLAAAIITNASLGWYMARHRPTKSNVFNDFGNLMYRTYGRIYQRLTGQRPTSVEFGHDYSIRDSHTRVPTWTRDFFSFVAANYAFDMLWALAYNLSALGTEVFSMERFLHVALVRGWAMVYILGHFEQERQQRGGLLLNPTVDKIRWMTTLVSGTLIGLDFAMTDPAFMGLHVRVWNVILHLGVFGVLIGNRALAGYQIMREQNRVLLREFSRSATDRESTRLFTPITRSRETLRETRDAFQGFCKKLYSQLGG